MTVSWFGRRLDAPAYEGAPEVPIPVGAECLGCEELIDEDDAGITMPYLASEDLDPDGIVKAVEMRQCAYHIECYLRSVVGSMAHLEKRCSCYGGTDSEGFSREDSRRVLETLLSRGARWAQQ